MAALTEFQEHCTKAVLTNLREVGLKARFKRHGESETYLTAAVHAGGSRYAIFIYEDEAGFFKDREWRP